jgi:aromatic ring-cleaving dioxygenase/transcriptional regulator with XRE-family HTH domain
MAGEVESSGELLRRARRQQRISQLELALRVGASQRHLSFLETGRSSASRGMLIALADALGMSPAGCNQLLLASGFAPRYSQRPLDDGSMEPVREALDHLLALHEPLPAWVLDPCWDILQFNGGADLLMASLTGRGLAERAAAEGDGRRVNILEAILHPAGLRSAIENFDEVAAHLHHHARAGALHTPALAALMERLAPLWPASVTRPGEGAAAPVSPVLSTRLRTPLGPLAFFSTLTTFGTPLDITVASLRVEHQFAADARTLATMRELARTASPQARIRDYHAHVYYDPGTTGDAARTLRELIGEHFDVRLGRWHDVPVGPHTAAMYQVAFAAAQFTGIVPFLMLERRGLSVLVHPNTGSPRADHLAHAVWLGEPLALKSEVLPVSEADTPTD